MYTKCWESGRRVKNKLFKKLEGGWIKPSLCHIQNGPITFQLVSFLVTLVLSSVAGRSL